MKKLMGMITVMMCVTATGCSAAEVLSSPPQPQITGGFTADCSVTAYIIPPGENAESETEFTFSGQTKRLGSGFWSMEITSPETIAGLTVSSADDVLTSHLGDLTFDVQTSSLPDSSPLTAFFSAMDNAAAQLESTSLSAGEDGGWVYSGDGCTIIFDSCGVPVSLATGQPKMTVSFSNFTAGEISETPLETTSTTIGETEVQTSAETTAETTAVTTAVTTAITTSVSTELSTTAVESVTEVTVSTTHTTHTEAHEPAETTVPTSAETSVNT